MKQIEMNKSNILNVEMEIKALEEKSNSNFNIQIK